MARRKWSWTTTQIHRADQVIEIVNDLENYWPLTIRQIHYQLFSQKVHWGGTRESGTYPNTNSGQNDLIKVAKYARLDGMLPWETIEARTRSRYQPYKFEDVQGFMKNELHYFLNDYKRCLVQDQKVYVEVWVEKDALFKIFKNAVERYCVPVVACRGYDSVTYLHNFYQNALSAVKRGQCPVVLYFGDLDPSGVNMFESSIETIREELGFKSAVFKRMAINPDHVARYNLPNDPGSGKYKDSRFGKYVDKYGHLFVELDALHPHQLETMVRDAVEAEFDMSLFREQEEIAEIDLDRIAGIKRHITMVVNEKLGTSFSV